jgi:hypothetical protein
MADEYGDGFVVSDRQPEHRLMAVVDGEGYVVGGHLLDAGVGPEFMDFIRLRRDALPDYSADVVMPAFWPVDTDGRGLSVLEVTREQHLTTKSRTAA